ncbi:DUF2937 family protein [Thalassotalea piscium]|uniref:DUF2937 family protein n=1 Tax=Thalassotalea piscium TaxID=1230533 RepID=A0A7X0NEX3_9GAMM|nr:DUF2937 family protein [Thalassotalea piscium]MBB6542202.1 hypothetical protein [Thalassotalea piscium]
MFKFFFQLIDKALFTVMFLVGVQLPAFINAYRQRLSGHLNEAQEQLTQYQAIADMQYQGSIDKLIVAFKSNSDNAIQQMSNVIANSVESVNTYQQQLFNLENANYLQRVFYFITQMDVEKALETLDRFVPAIPLELNAIITGVILSLLLSGLLNLIFIGGKKLTVKKKATQIQSTKKAQE